MKIRIEQLNPIVGDFKGNTALIINAIKNAETDAIDLLVLPELVVCGYPPMDLLEYASFTSAVINATKEIVRSVNQTAVIFGTLTRNESRSGRPLHNSALLAHNGKIIFTQSKTLLPTYDVFDESRYFEPAKSIEPVTFGGIRLGITICEDLWYNYNEKQYHIYDRNPAEILDFKGIDILINVSASPFGKQKPDSRYAMLRKHTELYSVPVIYANQVGANTELIFDGDSMAVDRGGTLTERTQLFKSDFIDVKFEQTSGTLHPITNKLTSPGSINERIFQALTTGLREYLNKTEISNKVILGLSGGIDSALTATIAAEALGRDHVIGVTMPSEFSSVGSVDDSVTLAKNLGITLHQIEIKDLYNTFLKTLHPLFKDTSFNVAEENLQSRTRGMLLMSLSNKFGYMLLNTGNKSEMAVGYCTLYGDMAGGLSLISDLYKTEVYALANWLNESYFQREVIPVNTITKPPSAELRPEQKDSDSLPDYDLLDTILKHYIEDQLSASEIISKGFASDVVKKVVRLVDQSEYKRRQAPPGLRISNKAFGVGRRWPIVQKWTGQQ